MANTIAYDYKVFDRYSGPLNKIRRATEKMRQTAKRTSDQVGKMGNKFKAVGSKMTSMQGAIAGAGAIIAIKSLVSESLKMEDAMADIAKVSELTGKPLMNMRGNLEKLSEVVGRPAIGLAQIAFEGKKLGATDSELMAYVKTVGKMAIAFEIAESEAGNAIGQIRAKLGYGMTDIVKFGDSANELANTMATNGQNIIQITQRLSGTFKTLEFPPGIAAGFAATADMLETSPELAASGMNMMIRKMTLMPGMTKKLMADPIKAMNSMMGDLAKIPVEKRVKKINKMFGAEAGRMVLKMTGNLDLFNKAMKTATQTNAVGSMDREMKNYLDRSSTKLNIALIKIKNSFRLLGDALVPFIIMIGNVFSRFASFAKKMSDTHPTLMKITAGILLLVAAITILMIPLGLAMVGFGAIMSMGPMLVAAFATISAGVVALTGFFAPLIAAAWAFTAALLANPITWIVIAVGALIAAIARLVTIWDKLKKTFAESGFFSALKLFFGMKDEIQMPKIKQDLGESTILSEQVAESSINVKQQQNVNVGGLIKVAAEKGSRVTSATPDLDTGTNMEFSL